MNGGRFSVSLTIPVSSTSPLIKEAECWSLAFIVCGTQPRLISITCLKQYQSENKCEISKFHPTIEISKAVDDAPPLVLCCK